MNYTAEERKRIAACLRRGLDHLWDGENPDDLRDDKEEFICFSLGASLGGTNADIILTREMIMSRLDNDCDTVEDWLKRRGYLDNLHGQERDKNVQAFRRRWMKALISEFSK
jgi:hypothetical protein